MVELAVQLTTPRPGTVEAQMQPREFLTSDPTIERIKRKACMALPDISPRAKRRLRFEPQANDDMTLVQYQEHAMHDCSRQDLIVMIPAHKLWPRTRDENTEMQDLTYGLCTRLEKLEAEFSELEAQCSELKAQSEELKARSKKQDADIEAMNRSRLRLLKGDTVLDLVNLLDKESLNQEGSITYLQQLAANATEKQLIEAGIPKKYWKIVRNLPVVITACNIESVHESDSEIDFARLLILEGPDAHNYQYWKDIFPILYGDSVEQVAGREDIFEKLVKLELPDT